MGMLVIGAIIQAAAQILICLGALKIARDRHWIVTACARAFVVAALLFLPAATYFGIPDCDDYDEGECPYEEINTAFGVVMFYVSLVASTLSALVVALVARRQSSHVRNTRYQAA